MNFKIKKKNMKTYTRQIRMNWNITPHTIQQQQQQQKKEETVRRV